MVQAPTPEMKTHRKRIDELDREIVALLGQHVLLVRNYRTQSRCA